MPPNISRCDLVGFAGTFLGESRGPQQLRTKQYTTNLQKNKTRLPLSPEVVAFQNSLPLSEGWGRQRPKQAAPRGGEPCTEPPVQPRDPAFPPEGQGPTVPPKAREDVGEKTPDHSILACVRVRACVCVCVCVEEGIVRAYALS